MNDHICLHVWLPPQKITLVRHLNHNRKKKNLSLLLATCSIKKIKDLINTSQEVFWYLHLLIIKSNFDEHISGNLSKNYASKHSF